MPCENSAGEIVGENFRQGCRKSILISEVGQSYQPQPGDHLSRSASRGKFFILHTLSTYLPRRGHGFNAPFGSICPFRALPRGRPDGYSPLRRLTERTGIAGMMLITPILPE
jgi:hypothetical protein